MRHFLSIVFGAAFTAAASWAIGSVLFARLRIGLRKTEHELLAAVTGAAVLSLLIFLLCATHLARIPVFWTVGLTALALNWKFSAAPAAAQHKSLPRRWKWVFTLPFAFYALLYLSNSLAPERSPDGQAYHLGVVYRYFRQHGFERLTTNMYANLSEGAEMLFLFAFSFGRHAAAATLHCCFLFALPLLLLSYGRRIGRPIAGACAGMLVYLSPIVGVDGVSAYIDVALAVACFTTFYLIELWRETRQQALLIPIGLVAGFCFAIKYTGYVAIAYALCIVCWELFFQRQPEKTARGSTSRNLVTLATVAGLVTVMAAPWLVKNWLWLGNPVSPFLNRVFPNPYTHITFEDYYRHYFSTMNLPSFKPLFWMATVKGQLDGQIGPVFLLAPLALLGLRNRNGRRILLAGLFFILPYRQNLDTRFLIPALPFAALGIALAFEFSRPAQATLVMLAALLAWPKVINRYRAPAGHWQIADMPWKAALGIIPQDTWLLRNDGDWVTARMLDAFVPEGKRVWSTSAIAEAYSKTDVLVNYYSAEGELIEDILSTPAKPDRQPTWDLRYSFAPQTMNHLRLIQHAGNFPDVWSIGEMRFFLGSQEIQPTKKWKLTGSSFPWDLALAFDRNPATRWRSWEPIHPGMYVDMDFGEPLTLDRVELHCSHDQSNINVGIEGVRASLEKVDDQPPQDLRRLATATVKARGIDYLMIGGDSWLATQMDSDPARWGLRKVADRGSNWLFQIQ